MICVSIGERTVAGCLEALKGLEFAEVRLDMIEPAELAGDALKRIFSQKARLIATCRPGKLGENERKKLLAAAIEAGAAYVDIELESGDAYKEELVAQARGKGCNVIISYHDYKRTPPAEELRQIVEWCFESGADIAKIACRVNTDRDKARLLGLLDSGRKLVVVGMGERGRITRAVAPLLGSIFTYASAGAGKETAEGQVGRMSLEKIIEELKGLG